MEPRPAYVEDESDEDAVRTHARAPPPSPPRARPNSGKSRERQRQSELAIADSSSEDPSDDGSDASPAVETTQEKIRRAKELDRRDREAAEKERKRQSKQRSKDKEQERKIRAEQAARSGKETKAPKKSRPHLHAAQTLPIITQHYQTSDRRPPVDSPYYGVQQPAAPSRPGARRPNSYYSGQPMPQPIRQPSGAPPAWQQDPIVGTFPPPLYPPSPMMQYQPSASGHASGGYFVNSIDDQERLRQRFNRPASAMGKPSMGHEQGLYDRSQMRPSHGRQLSHTSRQNAALDFDGMPPPNLPPRRTSSAMPTSGAYRPPPGPPPPARQHRPSVSKRRSIGYGEPPFELEDDERYRGTDLFNDMSPQAQQDRPRGNKTRHRRESTAVDYHEDYQLAPAGSRRSARSSMYGYPPPDSEDNDGEGYLLKEAERYMHMAGSSKTPLTENLLREANIRSGVLSSRSTHSSASRDDSEYRRSNATGPTTQYSDVIGDSDTYTVKLPKGAKFSSGNGFQFELPEAGEITVSRNRDRSMSELEMPARPQIEDVQREHSHRALEYRTRAPSQSGSLRRGYDPRWAPPPHAPYDPHLSAGNAF